MASFRRWLDQFSRDESAIGDLARDVAADPDWPVPTDLELIFLHMAELDASDNALEALRAAWDRWQREQPQRPVRSIPHPYPPTPAEQRGWLAGYADPPPCC
jgi:hypothetical protein